MASELSNIGVQLAVMLGTNAMVRTYLDGKTDAAIVHAQEMVTQHGPRYAPIACQFLGGVLYRVGALDRMPDPVRDEYVRAAANEDTAITALRTVLMLLAERAQLGPEHRQNIENVLVETEASGLRAAAAIKERESDT